jgi:hypothetical protein
VFGILKQRGVADSTCLFLLAACYLLGAAIITQVRTTPVPDRKRETPIELQPRP